MSIERARDLRQNQTKAEAKLWSALRNRQLAGLKFRRQVPLGPFIVDFLCESERLIVEVDGSQHALGEGRSHDAERTSWLEAEGYQSFDSGTTRCWITWKLCCPRSRE